MEFKKIKLYIIDCEKRFTKGKAQCTQIMNIQFQFIFFVQFYHIFLIDFFFSKICPIEIGYSSSIVQIQYLHLYKLCTISRCLVATCRFAIVFFFRMARNYAFEPDNGDDRPSTAMPVPMTNTQREQAEIENMSHLDTYFPDQKVHIPVKVSSLRFLLGFFSYKNIRNVSNLKNCFTFCNAARIQFP